MLYEVITINPGATYSDHASFWSNNFGAILLIEYDYDFNPYYHSANDLIQYFNMNYYHIWLLANFIFHPARLSINHSQSRGLLTISEQSFDRKVRH